MRDRLQNPEMTDDRARDIVSHVVAQRLRWGKHYQGDDIDGGMPSIFDALILLAYAEDGSTKELRDSLAKANRQLGAAKAREAKLKKRLEVATNGDPGVHTERSDEAADDVQPGGV